MFYRSSCIIDTILILAPYNFVSRPNNGQYPQKWGGINWDKNKPYR